MTRTELTDALEACSMERLRDIGYDLEAHADHQVRAQSKGELVQLIADTVEHIGEAGIQVLDEHDVGADAGSAEARIIQVAAHVPARADVRMGDIIWDPVDEVLGRLPHVELTQAEADHRVETGRGRWNDELSKTERATDG